jgi:hypothetical protein
VFNAEDGRGLGLTATTAGELVDAIGKADAHKGGPILIECQIPNDDLRPKENEAAQEPQIRIPLSTATGGECRVGLAADSPRR